MKKLLVLLSLVVLFSGCTQQSNNESVSASESSLQSFQGIGVLEFNVIKNQLPPGSSTYLKLRIRNNALGKTAENVVVKIDNLGFYSLLDCTSEPISVDSLSNLNSVKHGVNAYYPDLFESFEIENNDVITCGHLYNAVVTGADLNNAYVTTKIGERGDSPLSVEDELFLYDMDADLTVVEHGVQRLFRSDEYEFYWGILAPSEGMINNIYYKQNIYYVLTYDYSSENYFTVVAMSSEEVNRRRSLGESLEVPVDTSTTAGPISVMYNYLPVEFQRVGGSSLEYAFSFTVANNGAGSLSNQENSIIKVILPEEIDVTSNCGDWWDVIDCSEFSDFISCTDTITCDELAVAEGILLKKVDPENIVRSYNLQIPFKISSVELSDLRNLNIPIKTYSFKVEMNYSYNLEGSTSVHTSPIS
ncbi:MAG: hypothetical protein GON13_03375 [Nanoarchaeota archaeon]|nr:hypothetical protein [Nanoarchaeota archaeon]